MLAGVVFVGLGLGGTDVIDIKITDDFTLKTASVGFAIFAVSAVLLATLVLKAPLQPFADEAAANPARRIRRMQSAVLASSAIAVVGAIVVAIVDH
jgi:hypothetical protein